MTRMSFWLASSHWRGRQWSSEDHQHPRGKVWLGARRLRAEARGTGGLSGGRLSGDFWAQKPTGDASLGSTRGVNKQALQAG